jgi:hypothetical protein
MLFRFPSKADLCPSLLQLERSLVRVYSLIGFTILTRKIRTIRLELQMYLVPLPGQMAVLQKRKKSCKLENIQEIERPLSMSTQSQYPFKWRHVESEIILLCVRWYLRYALSYRGLEEMMAERGLSVDHTTISRWVQHDAPGLEKRCRPHLKATNDL